MGICEHAYTAPAQDKRGFVSEFLSFDFLETALWGGFRLEGEECTIHM